MQQFSTGFCNYLMGTGSFKALFHATTAQLRIYSGVEPATADAIAGTVIATVKEGGAALNWAAAPVGGQLAKSAGVWSDPAPGGGVAAYYRIVLAADDDSASVIFSRVQGTIGVGGADLNVGNTTIGPGAFTINVFTQTLLPD